MSNRFYTNVSRRGDQILYRGYDESGRPEVSRFRYKPRLFVPAEDGQWAAFLEPKTKLREVRFESMKECRDFIQSYADVDGYTIHGNDRHIYSFIYEQFPSEISFDSSKIRALAFDIEVAYDKGYSEPKYAENEVLTIAARMLNSNSDGYHIFGMGDYDPDDGVEYHKYVDEVSMLQGFIRWYEEQSPDIITGWNSTYFDVPYLLNRIARVCSRKDVMRFSPFGHVKDSYVRQAASSSETMVFDITGVSQLDYLDLFKKFTLHTYGAQESYKLEFIASVILGDETKIDYSDEGTLQDLHDKNYQKFCEYNIRDVELIEKFENTIGLIELVKFMSYFAGVNYSDTLGTVGIWDSIIFRNLAIKKIAIPLKGSSSSSRKFAGGYVKEVQTGFHDWVVSFDLNSLYPNLMVQYNISPETYTGRILTGASPDTILSGEFKIPKSDLTELNWTMTGSGACYSRDRKGILPTIIEDLYNQRVKYKNEQMAAERKMEKLGSVKNTLRSIVAEKKTRQTAVKILLNSLYGALGNKWFRYFNVDIAESITLSGQLVNRTAERAVNSWICKEFFDNEIEKDFCVAGDTDSIMFTLADVVKKLKPNSPVDFLDAFCEKGIEPVLEKTFEQFARDTNAYDNRMGMKREVIASSAIWQKKKRYLMNVLDNEGVRYNSPKLKIKGIEAIKSSTPKVCRNEFKRVFPILLSGNITQIQQEIQNFRIKFFGMEPHEIGMPRGASNITKWKGTGTDLYKKGVPYHVRGALIYNNLLKKHGLTRKYQPLRNGDRLYIAYLRKDNPTGENLISFPMFLPVEFGLHQYIDHETQFNKTYLEPLTLILDPCGWKAEYEASLESLFG